MKKVFLTIAGSAFQKYGQELEVKAEIDKASGEIKISRVLLVVEKIENALNSRIPEAIKDNTITDICGNIDKSSQFMLCGNPDMINDMVDLLGEYGLERNRRSKPGNITLEKYW